MNAVWLGLSFLTRIPMPPRAPMAGDLARSVRVWPLAGAIVAAAGLLGVTIGSWVVSPTVGAVAGLAAMVWVTGGFHIDGLSDSVDGLLCNGPRERRLEVMHDPRVGALGAAWTSLWLLLKAALLLATVEAGTVAPAAWAACILARAALPFEILAAPPATPGKGLYAAMKVQIRPRDAVIGAVLAALLVGPIPWFAPELTIRLAGGLACAIAVSLAWALTWRRTLGGLSGDTLGAAVELREAVMLAALAAPWGGTP